MFEKLERTIIGLAISISVIILAAVVILAVVSRRPAPLEVSHPQRLSETEPRVLTGPAEQSHTGNQHQRRYSQEHSFKPPAEITDESAKTDTGPAGNRKVSLSDIIRAARTWNPAYTSWYGKTAPDFTLTDITGKQHKLSDYRGKDILIIFWATWCRPCLMEIPDLIALRNTIAENKLAILAISNENPALVKKFTGDQKINYTVLLNPKDIPAPYNTVSSIPSSFFIDAEGKIKFGTVGVLSLGEIKAILQAPLEVSKP